MTRSFANLTIIALATLTLGAAVAQAQTAAPAPAPSNCGMETWSTDKMTYVGTPCPGGLTYENPSSPPQQ